MNPLQAKAALVAIASTGWLVPLWFAIDSYTAYWTTEAWPLLRGKYPLSSFPHLQFTALLLHIAILWFGIVVLFWSYCGYTSLASRRAA